MMQSELDAFLDLFELIRRFFPKEKEEKNLPTAADWKFFFYAVREGQAGT